MGQQTLLRAKHQKNMSSAISCIAGILDPLRIARQDCQLSQMNTNRCFVWSDLDCIHHNIPSSSLRVLLSAACIGENSARNMVPHGWSLPSI